MFGAELVTTVKARPVTAMCQHSLCQHWPRKVTTNPLLRNFSLYTETFLAKIVVRYLLAAFPDVRTVCLCSWWSVARSCTSAGRWYRERMVMWVAVQEVNSVWPQWAVNRWIWRPRHVMKTVIQMTRTKMSIRGQVPRGTKSLDRFQP